MCIYCPHVFAALCVGLTRPERHSCCSGKNKVCRASAVVLGSGRGSGLAVGWGRAQECFPTLRGLLQAHCCSAACALGAAVTVLASDSCTGMCLPFQSRLHQDKGGPGGV